MRTTVFLQHVIFARRGSMHAPAWAYRRKDDPLSRDICRTWGITSKPNHPQRFDTAPQFPKRMPLSSLFRIIRVLTVPPAPPCFYPPQLLLCQDRRDVREMEFCLAKRHTWLQLFKRHDSPTALTICGELDRSIRDRESRSSSYGLNQAHK